MKRLRRTELHKIENRGKPKEEPLRTTHKNGKVTAALNLLTEAANERKERFYELVNERAVGLKERLADRANQAVDIFEDTKKRLGRTLHAEEELIRRKAKEIDKKIHLNPWPVVGAAAFGAFVVGCIVRKKLAKSSQPKDREEENEQDDATEKNQVAQTKKG